LELFEVSGSVMPLGAATVAVFATEPEVAVTLAVTLPSVDDAGEAVELVRAAHQVCPYSNATRGNIDISLTANGHPVESSEAVAA